MPFPTALSIDYDIPANGSHIIREGDMSYTLDGVTWNGPGKIELVLSPLPHFKFTITFSKHVSFSSFSGILSPSGSGTLTFDNEEVKARFLGIHGLSVSGEIESAELGAPHKLQCVTCLIPNFIDFGGDPISDGTHYWSGRAEVIIEDWRLTLDSVQEANQKLATARITRGFAISHVCRIQRFDGGTFTDDAARKLLKSLFWFFSFCSGRWVGPLLFRGFNTNNEKTWERLESTKISPQVSMPNWFHPPFQEMKKVLEVLPQFIAKFDDPTWHEAIDIAIAWYVEANLASVSMEGSLVLAQASLEVLAYKFVIDEKKLLTPEVFDFDAANRFRLLIGLCSISADLPQELKLIVDAAVQWNLRYKDGPECITAIRNSLVHYDPQKRQKLLAVAEETTTEALLLALTYIELVLLFMFDYKGSYCARFGKGKDRLKIVPWAHTGHIPVEKANS